jgi:hypothetical protein
MLTFINLDFSIQIITKFLKKEDVAKCLSLSKNLLILFRDKGHPIFFTHRSNLCKSYILGADFIISNCKKRLSCNKNMIKHYCNRCGLFYKESSSYCLFCIKKK